MAAPSGGDGSSGQAAGSGAAQPTGCCTIMQPDKPGREYPHLTYAQCEAMANALPDATFEWVAGECAE